MNWLTLCGGAVLVLLVMVDACWTTLTTRGAGPVTGVLTNLVRWCASAFSRGTGRRGPLMAAGPIAIGLMGTAWLAGLWGGWLLIFSAIPGAVVNSSTMIPATDTSELAYFTGFTLSTLGVGDLVPSGAVPRFLTALASFNGLVLVTLGITYAVPLVGGAVERRELAFELSLINRAAQHEHTGESFLADALQSVRRDLSHCTEQRMAYPMLDLYYTRKADFSLPFQLAQAARLADLAQRSSQPPPDSRSELKNFLLVVDRYLDLHRLSSGSLEQRLRRLEQRDGWKA